MQKAKSGNRMSRPVAKTGKMRRVGRPASRASSVKQTRRAKPFVGGRGSG